MRPRVRQPHGVEVQIRVGMNSGEVAVHTRGHDLHLDYSTIAAIASRPHGLATPGHIWATAETVHLAQAYVQVTSLGPVPVKGLPDPVEVCELVGASPTRTRLHAFAARGLTPFVGRQVELAALHQALAQAGAEHGQVVAVMGEPGVGKTRLFHEFTQASHTQGWLLLESSSTSYGKATPYLPVIDLLKTYFQLENRDDGRRIREKLTGRLLTLDPALESTLPAFLALLEMPGEDPSWQALEPSQRRQRTLDALERLLLRESQVQPILLVLENLHWIDAETQAFLDGLVESLPAARLLLLVNYRPEYQHGWGQKTYYTQLRLDPLPPASAEVLLQGLLGGGGGLEPLKAALIERTQGNPFFLEESVRTLVETQMLIGDPGTYRLVKALPSIQVPSTVQAVLAARIDRLPPEEKALLQTAAVIGTEVPLALLQAVAEGPEALLRLGLTHLRAAEFLYETRLFPEIAYTFKHTLTQQVAYETLLQEQRSALHARIVAALEALAPDRGTEVASGRSPDQVERLAHHALRGEVWDKAVTYCQQAGARAFERAAFREAVAYFDQALQALVRLPETGDTRVLAIELRLALEPPLNALGDYGRCLALLGEAEALARGLDDRARLVRVLTAMPRVLRVTGDFYGAIAVVRQALDLAAEFGESALQVRAAHHLGQIYYAIGDFGRAAELLRPNVEVADRVFSTPRTEWWIQSRAWLARTLSALGAFAEGRSHGEEALRLAATEGHGDAAMIAHGCVGELYLVQGDLEHAIRVLEQGLVLCRASGSRDWLRSIMADLGYAYALQGRLAEGRTLLEEGISENIRTGARQRPRVVAWLSEICRLAGRGEEAWQHAHQALPLARQQKDRGDEALALHQLGVVYAHADLPDIKQAEAHYQQALTLGEELGMRPLQAHCHLGLGRLYGQTGRGEEARAALAAAIDLYRAMDMTFWLPQAEAALAQVA